MNKSTLTSLHRIRLLFFSVLAIACLICCDSDRDVISPEDFLKTDQEDLGDQLWSALSSSNSPLDVLVPEEHPELYTHLEALYKQSYFIMRAKQGWSTTHDWKISIFKEDDQAAFSFPGGNMMISTGMLKAFRKEYELFYLLSFENSLMDSGNLFANILTYIEDSIDIDDLIDEANREMATEIGLEIYTLLEFNALVTEEADLAAMKWICESSNFRIDGISQFLPRLDEDSTWKRSRMSALNRLNVVTTNFLELDCDNATRITSFGNDFYVNEILPLIP